MAIRPGVMMTSKQVKAELVRLWRDLGKGGPVDLNKARLELEVLKAILAAIAQEETGARPGNQ